MSYILVTGGAGYIGLHTVIELVNNGYNVVIVDNLVNSSYDAVARIEYIVKKPVPFFNVDLRDGDKLGEIFQKYDIGGVIHFAALKAVGESTKIPLDYYDNNVGGTISLVHQMQRYKVKTIVFSSSATVYGDATRFENMIPIPEHCPNDPTNPYGKTKYVIEQMLGDVYASDPEWKTAILRYFNPIGAHPSGLIGEDPLGIPNNLLPYLAQVAIGRREKLSVFGDDYDSHDGTPIRDYIHVVDLARGHLAALAYLRGEQGERALESAQKAAAESAGPGLFRAWNLGTGRGSTVFDVYHAFCRAVGRELPYEVAPRRAGDVLNLTANATRANTELQWHAHLSVDDACADLWRWTTQNPFGFNVEGYKWTPLEGYDNRLHSVEVGKFAVAIANHGATIQNISVDGRRVVCGFDAFSAYKTAANPFFGATVGRYANRIAGASFKDTDGKSYALSANENGTTTLHGGKNGYDKKVFLGPVAKKTPTGISLDFVLVDEAGENGFPATVEAYVSYLVEENSLSTELRAEVAQSSPDDATPVNLTNHTYFNLAGAGPIDGTTVDLVTTKYLASDSSNLPTGEFKLLKSSSVTLDSKTSFDDCFIVDENAKSLDTRDHKLQVLASASTPNSSISLKVLSTDPAFQFYTGDGIPKSEYYGPRSGFCIEPGRFTNAVNVDAWRGQVWLKKGEVYGSKLKYEFVKN